MISGIAAGWLDREKIAWVVAGLAQGEERCIEGLMFEFLGARLRVSFLDEQAWCSPAAMIAALATLGL
ncbi:MAG: hypothetical protein EOP84_10015 [Verrucomicrobiaceae bacterium]|nr:MAG: hypothetical protein EOP84_10015 [Verrucomicrobiaceae bacterium]